MNSLLHMHELRSVTVRETKHSERILTRSVFCQMIEVNCVVDFNGTSLLYTKHTEANNPLEFGVIEKVNVMFLETGIPSFRKESSVAALGYYIAPLDRAMENIYFSFIYIPDTTRASFGPQV